MLSSLLSTHKSDRKLLYKQHAYQESPTLDSNSYNVILAPISLQDPLCPGLSLIVFCFTEIRRQIHYNI